MADVSKLKKLRGRRAELGAPPTLEEASDNLAAPEVAPVAPVPEQAPAPARLPKMAVTDSEVLHQGEEVVVMLAKNGAGNYYVINDGQGMFVDTHTSNSHELFEHVSDHNIYTEDMLH